ncbi:DUF488 family protein [Leucobacter chromiiresistens]|uniref:DNA repair protein n=1 Tax=Leucobacter chromiiresistens TaxID=1079994 RepID=A0A1H0YM54_9MICO|nr:DUF488 domain-containing protein [Leucobacter chromiiresistens]SDQ16218.1 Protein of unknown function, DUF488 [Leucobacter chromiiresistens]
MPVDDARPQVLTVGHSTHSIERFVELLREAGVARVIDIRKLPGSRRFPQFDADALADSLRSAGIGYEREERLGGLRSASTATDPEVNGFWRNASFHRYADYAMTGEFRDGLRRVRELASADAPPALMCAEAVWWRCHRRIVADHLVAQGVRVAHLMPDGRVQPADLTPGARLAGDGAVSYPAD